MRITKEILQDQLEQSQSENDVLSASLIESKKALEIAKHSILGLQSKADKLDQVRNDLGILLDVLEMHKVAFPKIPDKESGSYFFCDVYEMQIPSNFMLSWLLQARITLIEPRDSNGIRAMIDSWSQHKKTTL